MRNDVRALRRATWMLMWRGRKSGNSFAAIGSICVATFKIPPEKFAKLIDSVKYLARNTAG
jgi:hypothetical protein